MIKFSKEVSEETYERMVGELPPIYISTIDSTKVQNGFAVSEPDSEIDGIPTFSVYFKLDGKHYQVLATLKDESGKDITFQNYNSKEFSRGNTATAIEATYKNLQNESKSQSNMKHMLLFESFLEEKLKGPKKPKSFVVKGYGIDEDIDPSQAPVWDDNNFGDLFDAKAPSKANEDSDKERYARVVKDIDEMRPRMAPAPKPVGMMASQGAKYFDLYLQDEASYVCVDKYGYDKGIKNWEWMIDQSSGVMFAATAKIANEKLQMLKDLGQLETYGKNYFARSYFDIWKEWKEAMKSGKTNLKQAA